MSSPTAESTGTPTTEPTVAPTAKPTTAPVPVPAPIPVVTNSPRPVVPIMTPVVTATPITTTMPAPTQTNVPTVTATPTPVATTEPTVTPQPTATLTPSPAPTPATQQKFGHLKAKIIKTTKSTIKVQWTGLPEADGYIIYSKPCNHHGKQTKQTTRKVVSADKRFTIFRNLPSATYYKYTVHAYKEVNNQKIKFAKSVMIHATTKGGKFGIAKDVKIIKIGKKTYNTRKNVRLTLKKGKSVHVFGQEVRMDSRIARHRPLSLESSDTSVVKIDTNNRNIKAVGKGKADVWIYAQNGVYKTIHVTVK